MAIDFATLEIRAKFSDIDGATRALERLRVEGQKAEKQTDAVGAATGRAGSASSAAAGHLGAWDAIQKQATGHTGEHSLALGRLERNLAGVTERVLQLNPTLGLVSTSLLKFGIGTIETIGILAGIAAIAFAYEKLTADSRKEMDAADKLAESYNRAARVASLGFGGQQKADIEDLNKGLEQHNKWLGFIIAARVQLGSLGGLFGSDPGGHAAAITSDSAAARAAEQQRVNAIGLQDARDNEAWAARIKDANEKALAAAAKAQADLLRYTELMARMYGTSSDGMTSVQRAWWLSYEHGRGMSDRERADAMGLFNVAPDKVSMPSGIDVNLGLTSAQIHKRRALGIHLDGDTNTGLDAGIAGAMSQFSPANLAGEVVSSLLGTAIQGVTGMLHDLFTSGKEAAEHARRMAEDFKFARASFLTGATGDSFGSSILSARKALTDELNALADRLKVITSLNSLGLGHTATGPITQQIAAATAAEQAQEQRIKQYAQEDLSVRNLRALGQGSQADVQAFKNQQAREMQAAEARVANAETAQDKMAAELYRNTLATTESNELLAFQNGLLSMALRNAPSGFYGVASYVGEFAQPRGPMDSGPPSNGGGDNSNGGLQPPGGRTRPGVTFDLRGSTFEIKGGDPSKVFDGFVGELKKRAGTVGGPNASLSSTLDVM